MGEVMLEQACLFSIIGVFVLMLELMQWPSQVVGWLVINALLWLTDALVRVTPMLRYPLFPMFVTVSGSQSDFKPGSLTTKGCMHVAGMPRKICSQSH
jgi:hypothetical protein